MIKKLSKKLLEQMTISERFNYISALKQMQETISQAKDSVSENGDEDWVDGVDEGDNKSSDEGKSQDYNVWVDGEYDDY
jgi:FKBP-type peptidyl-prolyl cis-trans isomerase (trigger factor)